MTEQVLLSFLLCMMMIVTGILLLAAFYLILGLLFAIPFVIKGVTKIDEGAKGTGWGFRIIIIPGVVICWPLLLKKWRKTP
jgi:hypothetical protein